MQKAFDEHVGDLKAKMKKISSSVSTLRLQIESKDAVSAHLQSKNDAVSCEFANAQAINDDLHQQLIRDNLIFAGFTPWYNEIIAGEGGNNRQRVSVKASIDSAVTFYKKTLAMPKITARVPTQIWHYIISTAVCAI